MYENFGLTLMLTHACNLRCSYCYTGAKVERAMPLDVARKAVVRSVASVAPGGTLNLGFFGGEPLLCAPVIMRLIRFARRLTQTRDQHLRLSMTTNGTIVSPDAWRVMMTPELDLSISCDGTPTVHDRHRITPSGRGTSARVHDTIRRLVSADREFWVIAVVRPDTIDDLPEGIAFLQSLGVRRIQPTLDLWTEWRTVDIERLEFAIDACAAIWRRSIPDLAISWFDSKAGMLVGAEMARSSRCAFGRGEVAVAPSGRVYPCERLIGEDLPGNPMAFPGRVFDGADFLAEWDAPTRSHESCDACAMSAECDTVCRCSNYVRTWDVATPDRLLCTFNQACLTATADVLNEPVQLSTRMLNQGVLS
ncbi:MAG TPA: radical SAM protein [Phycisphaerae bacterium]|nr:radical SAM protein [Phycisphaerae bacterium]